LVETSRSRVCALIPAYNEADRIGTTVDALLTRPEIGRIVVVDDGSTDATAATAREAGAHVVLSQQNAGKGAALRAAYLEARDAAEIFLLLDADLAATAGEAVKLIIPVLRNKADMTVGVLPPDPDFAATGQSGGMGFVVKLARRGIEQTTGRSFTQPLSGQRSVRREVIEALRAQNEELFFAAGFGVEVGLTIAALRAGFRVVEVETCFRHKVTGSDWPGLMHRLRQYRDVARTIREYRRQK
jgi:glucosyl-3-phosphoglycerate synthase